MRIPNVTIPSSYLKLDDSTTAADEFANAHDLQTVRANQNILLAKRIRRSVLNVVYQSSTAAAPLTLKGAKSVDCLNVPCAISEPIVVSQYTKELTVVVEACKSSTTTAHPTFTRDPSLYAIVHRLNALKTLSNGGEMVIAAAAATPTKYTVDIPVPIQHPSENWSWGFQQYLFELYYSCPIDSQAVPRINAAANVEAGESYIDINNAAGLADDLILVQSDLARPPRQIIRKETLASGDTRYFFDKPLTYIPRFTAGSADTITVREVLGIDLYSLSVYEKTFTDFFEAQTTEA